MALVTSTFLDHLKEMYEGYADAPADEVWNEIIRATYAELVAAVREQVDMLTISSNQITQRKNGVVVWQRDIRRHEQGGSLPPALRGSWMSYRTALQIVVGRDRLVRRYLQPVQETADQVVYHLLPEAFAD